MRFTKLIILLLATLFSSIALSAPTAQQIAQFKKLPKSQQISLAKQYGIDLNSINSGIDSSVEDLEFKQTIEEREIEDGSREPLNEEEKKHNPTQEPLKPFGYKLFAGNPTTFSPSESASVSDDYIVGTGDEFIVSFYGKKNYTERVVVDREGRLTFEKMSPVIVAGLTYAEVKLLVKNKIAKEQVGGSAFVSLGKLKTMRILVLGESFKPGSYNVTGQTTVSHALFVSGGLTKLSSLRNIQVKRTGRVIAELDLYSLLLNGDSSQDIILKPNDVVFIPTVAKQVSISGAVARPAIYELKENESITDLLDIAGGVLPSAFTNKVQIKRFYDNTKVKHLTLEHSDLNSKFKPAAGDEIFISELSEQINDVVKLIGAVSYPGDYQWFQGMQLKDIISSIETDILPLADLSYVLLVREINSQGTIVVKQLDLRDLEIEHSLQTNLDKKDKIIVFSRFQLAKNESEAFANYAFTEKQIIENKKESLWQDYQLRQFEDFVGGSITQNSITEGLKKGLSKRNKEETKVESGKNDWATFSRHQLLKPIVAKLAQQSTHTQEELTVKVSGHVRFPGVYPLSKGADVEKLVIAAGGLRESAFLSNAEITRVADKVSNRIEHISIDLGQALQAPTDANFLLRSKDTLTVFPIPNWKEQVTVTLKGEVNFPGVYQIKPGESLLSVVSRAGGFTEYGDVNSVVFTRESLKAKEEKRLLNLTKQLRQEIASKSIQSRNDYQINYSEINKLLQDLNSAEAVGRLVIDLERILKGKEQLTLKDGDSLYVLAKPDSVSVIGEVNFPTSYLYEGGLTLEDYLAKSGGKKERASEDIYIISANGSIKVPNKGSWFSVDQIEQIQPGDTIVVPLNTEYMDNLTLWSNATQVLYQLGIAVAAIGSL